MTPNRIQMWFIWLVVLLWLWRLVLVAVSINRLVKNIVLFKRQLWTNKAHLDYFHDMKMWGINILSSVKEYKATAFNIKLFAYVHLKKGSKLWANFVGVILFHNNFSAASLKSHDDGHFWLNIQLKPWGLINRKWRCT